MGVYEVAKDALKIAQKADNAELIEKLLDVQKSALEMQEKQFDLNKQVESLSRQVEDLRQRKKYIYEEGHEWMVDPESTRIKLCPVCLNRDGFENPLPDPRSNSRSIMRFCSVCHCHFN
jgi:hypothetical protein